MGNFKTMKEWKSLLNNQTIYFEEGNRPTFLGREFITAVHFGIPNSCAGYKSASINSPRNLILELVDDCGNTYMYAINLKTYSSPHGNYLSVGAALELDNLYYFIKELQNH